MKRLNRYLLDRPAILLGLVILGICLLPLALWMDLKSLSSENLNSQATTLNRVISSFRAYYAENVVKRVNEAGGAAHPLHNYRDVPGGIPIPATLSIELANAFGAGELGFSYRFVSRYPFPNRPPHQLSDFELKSIEEFERHRDPEQLLTHLSGTIFNQTLTVAAPIVMSAACVACHNSHPESPRKDWNVGDVRGIQAIMVEQPLLLSVWSFKWILTYMAVAGTLGLFFARGQFSLSSEFAQLNRELDGMNADLAGMAERLKSENLRLGAELDVARRIQMMVLPQASNWDDLSGIDIAACMEPADEVGGDYFDVLVSDGTVKVGIGDVTGHGLESGVLMLMVQSVARALQEHGSLNPIDFLDILNRSIFKNVQRMGSDKHLTLAFLDVVGDEIHLSGQHESVIVIGADNSVEIVDTMDCGFPVGLEQDISSFLSIQRIAFTPGTVVVLYTDGITEARNEAGEMYGLDRLCETAVRARGEDADKIKQAIIASLRRFVGRQRIDDDVTLLVLKRAEMALPYSSKDIRERLGSPG